MDLRTEYYALDRGLDGTPLLHEPAPTALPEQSSLVPPQGRYPAQLQQLLEKPDLGNFLQDAFVMSEGDAVLSGPSQFAAALARTQAELLALLSESEPDEEDDQATSEHESESTSGPLHTKPTKSPKASPDPLLQGSPKGVLNASLHTSPNGLLNVAPNASRNMPPHLSRLVRRARRVLKRESGLRADLASYRAALLKG